MYSMLSCNDMLIIHAVFKREVCEGVNAMFLR